MLKAWFYQFKRTKNVPLLAKKLNLKVYPKDESLSTIYMEQEVKM